MCETPKCSIQVRDLWAFMASRAATQADASLPLLLHVGKNLVAGGRKKVGELQTSVAGFPLDAR